MRLHPIMLSGITDQTSPPATNIQKFLILFQPKLPADHLELVDLSLFERVFPVGKVSTGVQHLGVEKQSVEVVAYIIVELDETLVVSHGTFTAGFFPGVTVLDFLLVLPRK